MGPQAVFRACLFGGQEAIFHMSYNRHPVRTDIQHASSREHGTLWVTKCARLCWISLGVGVCYATHHAIIAFVPKYEHCPLVTELPADLLCNVVYKAITKIIADRLAPILEHLINCCQAVFVGGRNITDNIFLAPRNGSTIHEERISPRCNINV
ncbi:UNVERIFIED_CONTAM: hypothetical protein Slati_3394800 [Sesamum latifolium]|uniref:Reverse transcriptase n=1 Tax=Sesamum latifolium TaxID=2727402 RepID=A0AAW2UEC7_9LAMI